MSSTIQLKTSGETDGKTTTTEIKMCLVLPDVGTKDSMLVLTEGLWAVDPKWHEAPWAGTEQEPPALLHNSVHWTSLPSTFLSAHVTIFWFCLAAILHMYSEGFLVWFIFCRGPHLGNLSLTLNHLRSLTTRLNKEMLQSFCESGSQWFRFSPHTEEWNHMVFSRNSTVIENLF